MRCSLYRVNFQNYGFTTQLKIPRLTIEGVYTVKGRVLVLPLAGHGVAWLEPGGCPILHTLSHLLQMSCIVGLNTGKVIIQFCRCVLRDLSRGVVLDVHVSLTKCSDHSSPSFY